MSAFATGLYGIPEGIAYARFNRWVLGPVVLALKGSDDLRHVLMAGMRSRMGRP